jgi:hypothetical protein
MFFLKKLSPSEKLDISLGPIPIIASRTKTSHGNNLGAFKKNHCGGCAIGWRISSQGNCQRFEQNIRTSHS